MNNNTPQFVYDMLNNPRPFIFDAPEMTSIQEKLEGISQLYFNQKFQGRGTMPSHPTPRRSYPENINVPFCDDYVFKSPVKPYFNSCKDMINNQGVIMK